MRKKLFILFFLCAFTSVFSQYSATITVNDATISQPVEGAQVTLNSTSLTTNASGQVVFTDLANGDYNFTVSKTCYVAGSGSVTVADANASQNTTIAQKTTNDVLVVIGDFFINPEGYSINLTNGGSYNETIVSGNPLEDTFSAVPYGTYNYKIWKYCYEPVTGTVVVECKPNNDRVGIFAAEPIVIVLDDTVTKVGNVLTANATGVTYQWENCSTNDIVATTQTFTATAVGTYKVVVATASCTATSQCIEVETVPHSATITVKDATFLLPVAGAQVVLYATTLTTDANGQVVFANLPDNPYSYTVTKDCYVEGNGSLIVAGSDVTEEKILTALTTNDIYVYAVDGMLGVNINATLTNGTDTWTGSSLDYPTFSGIPYGDYTITIVKNCYQTYIETVHVGCNAEGITVVANLNKVVDSTVTQVGNVLTANASGMTYQWRNCSTNDIVATTQTFTATVVGTYKVVVSNGSCTATSQCINVATVSHSATITVKDASTSQPVEGAQVTLNSTSLTTNASGQVVFTDLANGDYNFIVSKTCYVAGSGSVTVADANAEQTATIALQTANDLFIAVSNGGFINPLQGGFKIDVTGPNNFNQTFTSDNQLATYIGNLPYGDYNYTISKNCFVTKTGTATVGCNAGAEVSVIVIREAKTTNDVLVIIGDFFINPEGYSINLTNGGSYNETIVSGNPLEDVFTGVPYGTTYTYTISKDCYEPVTGTVVVECKPNNDRVGIFAAEPSVIVIDDTVTQASNVLTANATGVTYQWVDCNNENTPIEDATAQSFTATVNGSYAVIITDADCSTPVTSACVNVSTLAVATNVANLFSIYPNPAQNSLTIDLKEPAQNASVEIINMLGQTVFSGKYSESNSINLNVSQFTSGVYIINVNADNNVSTKRFIKE